MLHIICTTLLIIRFVAKAKLFVSVKETSPVVVVVYSVKQFPERETFILHIPMRAFHHSVRYQTI
jgi:hypothetical protein